MSGSLHRMSAQHAVAVSTQPRARRFACGDGLTLHGRQWGDATPACLLIHGFGEGAYVWDTFATELSAHAGVLAIDLRGHGDSEWDPWQRYRTPLHADDVGDIVDVLGLERVVLVGHSMGGDIAIRVAASRQNRVAGLAIIDFGPDIDPASTDHIRAEFRADSRIYRSISEYIVRLEARYPLAADTLLSHLAHGATRALPDGRYQLKRDPAMGLDAPSDAGERQVLWTLLRQLSCPVLVVRGIGSSVLARPVAEQMIAALREGSFVSVPRAGHAVMIDNPKGFADAVGPFITRELFGSAQDARLAAASVYGL